MNSIKEMQDAIYRNDKRIVSNYAQIKQIKKRVPFTDKDRELVDNMYRENVQLREETAFLKKQIEQVKEEYGFESEYNSYGY